MDPSLEQLVTWVKSHGGDFFVEIGYDSEKGRNLSVTKEVSHGDVLVSIPEKLVFHIGHMPEKLIAISDDVPEEIVPQKEARDLLLLLAYERAKTSSFWDPYFASLPDAFDTIILQDETDEYLEGTPLKPLAERLRSDLNEALLELLRWLNENHPEEFSADHCTLDTLRWAHGVSESRGFKVLCNDEERTVLIPLVDLANHDPDADLFHDSFDSEKGFQLRIKSRSFAAGEQLLVKYGKLANWELLLHYGFAIQNNPDDRIDICLEEKETDEDYETVIKRELFFGLGSELGLGYEHSFRRGEGASPALLASLRLLTASAADLTDINVTNLSEKMFQPLSEACEREVFYTLDKIIRAMQENLPRTLQEDEESLSTGQLSLRQRFGLLYRIEYQKILAEVAELIRAQGPY
mmetsp:Transcript_3946/g.11817  ORF Transcript_3946/g.11817 Transcript_3946/m.11817 type:complete len:408 (+) Transcript_3946:17-1240(+)